MSEPDVSDLITVQQAIEILDAAPVQPRRRVVSIHDAQGLRLAHAIVSDRDYPPADKSLMDGFALRCGRETWRGVESGGGNALGRAAIERSVPARRSPS